MGEVKSYNKNIKNMMGEYHKATWTMAWPMIISMLITTSYNLGDGIIVSILGTKAFSAVGFVTPLFMVATGLANGLAAGSSSFIARKIGAKDKEGADLGASQSIFISIFVSIILTVIILIFQKNILLTLGASSVIDLALEYSTVSFIGIIFILISSILTGVFRAVGDVKRPLYVLASTAVLNTFLDYIFASPDGFNLGISSVALGTIIASGISSFIFLYWLIIKKDTYVNVKKEYLKPNWNVMKGIFTVGIPASLEMFCSAVMVVIINAVFAHIANNHAVASYAAGMRIILFAMVPTVGLSMATISVAGSSYGAGLYKKVRNIFLYSLKLGLILSVSIGLIIFIFAPHLSLLFCLAEDSKSLTDLVAIMLRIYFVFFIAMPIGLIPGAFFQSLGKGSISLGLTIIRENILSTLSIYIFAFVLNMGILGVFLALVLGKLVGSLIGFLYANYYSKNLIKKMDKNKATT